MNKDEALLLCQGQLAKLGVCSGWEIPTHHSVHRVKSKSPQHPKPLVSSTKCFPRVIFLKESDLDC